MKAYQICMPTQVFFGRNIWKEALQEQEAILTGNIMIVTTGRSLIRLGYLDALEEQVKRLTLVKKVIIFDHVSANPRLSEAEEGIRLGKKEQINVVIGFGGGSAIDMAKAVAAGVGGEELEDLFYREKEPGKRTLPIIAMPTTAGTGSELSKAAILTDDGREMKSGIRGRALYPKIAIIDSIFTESVPVRITMETGFDVLAHAIESYVSKASSPYTQMQSEYAVRIVGEALPHLALKPEDTAAREKMSYASMIMGINLGNASTCLPHRLQYPLGAHTDTSHGLGLAALYTAWVTYEYEYAGDKLKKVMHLLTGKNCQGSAEAVEAMRSFLKGLGLPVSMHEIGVTESLIDRMVGEVTGSIQNDLVAQDEHIIEKIYRKAF